MSESTEKTKTPFVMGVRNGVSSSGTVLNGDIDGGPILGLYMTVSRRVWSPVGCDPFSEVRRQTVFLYVSR